MRIIVGLAAVAIVAFFCAAGRADEPRDQTGKIDDYNQWKQSLGARRATDPATISAPPGFRVELLRSAGSEEGSWIALAFDSSGRIIVSREDKGLLRFTLAQNRSTVEQVETVNDTLLECRGLLWAYDSLYANANYSKGLYRLRDTDGDDRFDEVKLIKATPGDFGHGRNDLALGPDGMIYSIHGDDVRLPDDYDPTGSPLRNYSDARLLPCRWDRELFNSSANWLPGGYVARTDRDGQRWEVIAGGLRNPYGLDFSPGGELFTYDADMEWDVGTPWYRPTRILHLISGADFGWRVGTGPWRAWYPESPPAVLDMGLGSPTAVRFGTRSRFPARYRRALFVCDWTFGRILAIEMQPQGASFAATAEPFLSGRPLNVTDIEFGPDGALYFLTGGRKTQSGLYRVTFGGEMTDDQALEPLVETEAATVRKQLESLHHDADPAAIATIWPHLRSDDLFVRHAARVALERRLVATWRDHALAESDFTAATTALLALARLGEAETQGALLARLAELPWDQLTSEQRVTALRTWSLGLARHDRLADDRLAPLAESLNRRFPDADARVNELLCELLVYLRSPQVVPKALELLQTAKTQEEKLQILFLLRSAQGPWTLTERKTYFDSLRQARHFYGGNAMPRIQAFIRADAVAGLSDAERATLAPLLVDESPATEVFAPLAQRPFVRDWKLDDLVGSLEQVGHGRNLAAGKETFAAAMCNRCHRLADHGTPVGPDLTPLARRFGRVDILLSILAPSRVVDDKYRQVTIETTDGRVLTGQIAGNDGETVTLRPDLLAADKMIRVAKSQIESQTNSLVSPMPAGLLNSFSKDEVLDLLAYLESEGETTAAKPLPDTDGKPLARAVQDAEAIDAIFPAGAIGGRLAPALVRLLSKQPDVAEATGIYLQHLIERYDRLPPKPDRFGLLMQAAFELAAERSSDHNPALENRAAILALAILLGHADLQPFVGALPERDLHAVAKRMIGTVTLRGRTDWPRHFLVSAALALLFDESTSARIGRLKEQLDLQQGGSDFSFADMLANGAGIRLATAATRNEASARAVQRRLARGFEVDAFFPPANGLPENIPAAEFKSRYGGIGGAGYRAVVDEIQRRLDALPKF